MGVFAKRFLIVVGLAVLVVSTCFSGDSRIVWEETETHRIKVKLVDGAEVGRWAFPKKAQGRAVVEQWDRRTLSELTDLVGRARRGDGAPAKPSLSSQGRLVLGGGDFLARAAAKAEAIHGPRAPATAQAYRELGDAYRRRGRRNEAAKAYQRCLSIWGQTAKTREDVERWYATGMVYCDMLVEAGVGDQATTMRRKMTRQRDEWITTSQRQQGQR